MFDKYDVIVVGAGHAGCEAAVASAKLGSKVLLITMNMQTIAQMSCNPAMGGIAKGQILREVDALGGYSSIVTDESLIQFRMLNKSKGPAMWSPRSQNDRVMFSLKWREKLELTKNIDFFQDSVIKLLIYNNKCIGVSTGLGNKIFSQVVILTTGTFLNGVIHIGETKFEGGRISEKRATGITEQLANHGFETSRLKTGTPPRVDGRSLDYSIMEEQKGDDLIIGFSFLPTKIIDPISQKSCFITYTNQNVHEKLKEGFDKSPMFTGRIEGIGPRYCPSVEDKINRFSDKERHQIFVEPEGFNTIEIYVNGFSTSLPQQIQYEALKLISGFEKVKMFRPGYAIEYDFFPPTQLKKNLETKNIENLFFAGQINGTTGYEEAACQGIMAGINAHQKINEFEPFILSRNEAYIGVLIDDLVTKGTNEPYRMFTSRAEFRTLLRQDNADLRLTEKSYHLGLAGEERMHLLSKKVNAIDKIKSQLNTHNILPKSINNLFVEKNSSKILEKQKARKLLLRPNISLNELIAHDTDLSDQMKPYNREELEQAEIQIKYESYIQKEEEIALKISQLEHLNIPESIDYEELNSISSEAVQKFKKIKPKTLGQAGRISGVNPSDLQILMLYIKR